jgi:hypothetical protein
VSLRAPVTNCVDNIPSGKLVHVRWVPCHHGRARPQVADEGFGLQIWRVAAYILNKQSRTADKGWSSSLGDKLVTKIHKKPRTWTDSLDNGPKHKKTGSLWLRIGTSGRLL